MKNDTTGRSTLKSRRLFNNDSSVIVADIVLDVGIHIKGDEGVCRKSGPFRLPWRAHVIHFCQLLEFWGLRNACFSTDLI